MNISSCAAYWTRNTATECGADSLHESEENPRTGVGREHFSLRERVSVVRRGPNPPPAAAGLRGERTGRHQHFRACAGKQVVNTFFLLLSLTPERWSIHGDDGGDDLEPSQARPVEPVSITHHRDPISLTQPFLVQSVNNCNLISSRIGPSLSHGAYSSVRHRQKNRHHHRERQIFHQFASA